MSSRSALRDPSAVLEHLSHRPWPLPSGPWFMSQRWCDLLFAHWPVPIAALRGLIPERLEIDTRSRAVREGRVGTRGLRLASASRTSCARRSRASSRLRARLR